MDSSSSSSRELSPDMIFEILSRTSLQALDSSRIVCKEWNNLSYDPSFTHAHARNTNMVSGYLVQSTVSTEHKSKFVSSNRLPSNNLPFDFLPRNMRIEASSDQGLFVYVSRENRRYDRYFICKPSTKEVLSLPNPKMRYVTKKVALVVLAGKPLHFKIIRLSWPKHWLIGYVSYKCEIFDSAIWAWKKSTDILLPHGEFITHWSTAIFARGFVHFFTTKDRVLAFEESSKSYNVFPLPRPAFQNFNYGRKRIVKFKGRLGFTCREPINGCLELWVLKKYGTDQPLWKKRIVLRTQVLEGKEDYPVLGGFCNSGVALVEGEKSVIFYDTRNCDIYEERLKHRPDELFAFRSDFEPTCLNR